MSIHADRIIAVRTSKTVYRDGDTVIKVFDEEYSKANVLNEALNQARIEELGLKVPRILEVLKMDDKWAIRLDYVEGRTLQRLMEENPEKASDYLEQFVELQKEVNAKEARLLNRQKDKLDMRIEESDLDATMRLELHARLDQLPSRRFVCHGDFVPANIVMKKDGSLYILDWAHVTRGDPAGDAARSYLLLTLREGKELAEAYLETYCKKTQISRESINRWMPIVAGALSVGRRGEERARLLQYVNTYDYQQI